MLNTYRISLCSGSFQPPNLESIDHQTGSAAGGDRSRLLVELCAERDALLRLGQGSQGDDDDEDGNETPRHSLRLLEDGKWPVQGWGEVSLEE